MRIPWVLALALVVAQCSPPESVVREVEPVCEVHMEVLQPEPHPQFVAIEELAPAGQAWVRAHGHEFPNANRPVYVETIAALHDGDSEVRFCAECRRGATESQLAQFYECFPEDAE